MTQLYHSLTLSKIICLNIILHRYLLSNVHCCTIHNSQEMEQAKCSSTDEWVMTMQYIYTLEYYSIVKKMVDPEKILLDAIT